MCGICGELNVKGDALPSPIWDQIIDRMQRRGPDQQGLWRDDGFCVLGSARLSIVDTGPAGNMPMVSDDGRHAIVFNGELYNFRELREKLEAKGHRFRSSGDTEVVLKALIEWSVDALELFNGMFALAFYCCSTRSLLLARDHAGIKPLYVLSHAGGVVFASQYEQVLAHPAAGREMNGEAIAMYLRLGHIPAPWAAITGTSMLSPGHWLRVDADGDTREERWFTFPEPGEQLLTGAAAAAAVASAVASAVRRQMICDVPIGCFLSGGVDSPLVGAMMQAVHSAPVPSFSVGMDDPALDESADAERYARVLGTDHELAHFSRAHTLDLFHEALDAMGEPLADEGILPTLLVSRIARRKVIVALSGEGGDELFWGYYPRQSKMLGPGASMPGTGENYLEFFSDFSRRQFHDCFPDLQWWPQEHSAYAFREDNWRRLALRLRRTEFDSYLPFILLKTDRASMHHSLEVRVPLLDREVIDVASRIDPAACLDFARGLGKLPLRRTLERHTSWQTHAKKGFTVPIAELVRGPLAEMVADSLNSLGGLESIRVDKRCLRRMFERHRQGTEDNGMALWRILVLDQWAKRHLKASKGISAREAPFT